MLTETEVMVKLSELITVARDVAKDGGTKGIYYSPWLCKYQIWHELTLVQECCNVAQAVEIYNELWGVIKK